MMKIENPGEKPLREIAEYLSQKYPGVTIKKSYFIDTIFVPSGNLKFVLRDRTSFLIADFVPPILLSTIVFIPMVLLLPIVINLTYEKSTFGIGKITWVFLLFVIGRAIYKYTKKEQFEQFYSDVADAIQAQPSENAIF
ncbi:hypothetical protein DBR32_11590 [Taibaiella sp. KBW10]|uniref:hypothetical protein n=1 Tax=Taibaiella sp. KBW10 TaxID=2153357 RepID=UPI000F5AE8EF|nr:hypothetical protein [Taibaiella sp. KBW10]RQO30215.1 hypothetical protein DBR32_11590 [Taibaiella sp. KBW10]